MGLVGDEADCSVKACEGIPKSLAKTLGSGDRVFVENKDGVFLSVEELPVDFEAGRGNPLVVAAFLPSVDLGQWCLLTSCR